MPPIKEEAKNFLKSTSFLFPLLYLEEGNEEGNPSAPRPMGQLALSEEPARPPAPAPSGGQVLSPKVPRARGGAGMSTCRSASSRPPERGLWAPLTPRAGGPGNGPGTSPRAWRLSGHWELPRCHLRGRGGARGAGCWARESAAASSNPSLSSLRLRHARSASRARRVAVPARGSHGAEGSRRGGGGQESSGPHWVWGDFERKARSAPRASRGAQVTSPDRQPPPGGRGAWSRRLGE